MLCKCEYRLCLYEESANFIAALILFFLHNEKKVKLKDLNPVLMDLVDLQQMGIKVWMKTHQSSFSSAWAAFMKYEGVMNKALALQHLTWIFHRSLLRSE